MTDAAETNEMERHAVVVYAKAKYNSFESYIFVQVIISFLCKVRKELSENKRDEFAQEQEKTALLNSDSVVR